MKSVLMYTTLVCPYCIRAEQLLRKKGVVSITKIRTDQDPTKLQEMMERTGRRTVPQIFIGDHHVGGCDDLYDLESKNQLESLLSD